MEVFNTRRKSMLFLFVFIILFSLMSNSANAENRPGFVCGQFNKNIIEVPDNYIYSFAEYEGYSYFDPRFVQNKKGCEANFRVLPMRVSWPEMDAIDESTVIRQSKEIMEISIEPLNVNPNGYLNYKKNRYLDSGYRGIKGEMIYDENLELYFTELTAKTAKIRGSNKIYINKYGYYWSENNGQVSVLFSCLWIPSTETYTSCQGYYLMPEVGAKVEISFKIKELPYWKNMIEKTRIFILNHIKN